MIFVHGYFRQLHARAWSFHAYAWLFHETRFRTKTIRNTKNTIEDNGHPFFITVRNLSSIIETVYVYDPETISYLFESRYPHLRSSSPHRQKGSNLYQV